MNETDIVVGILSKNVEATILHVLNVVSEGLHKHFSEYEKTIIVSDGFSSDKTVELANLFQPYNGIRKLVTHDLTKGGKGAGARTIFMMAKEANAKAVVLIDGDLLSIKPEWIREFISPILYGRADLVVPYYIRDKYDGVITNNLVYPFTRAVYGLDIRQPIAGEYGLSKNLYEMLLEHSLFPLDFGIDIFIVTTAAANQMEIREGIFSLKIHESTTRYLQPEQFLIPMFRQVTGKMFELASYYENYWKNNRKRLHKRNTKSFLGQKPIPTRVDIDKMRKYFEREYKSMKNIIDKVLPPEIMKKLSEMDMDAETWAEVVYNFAKYYKVADERHTSIEALKTLWLLRFITYANEVKDMEWNEAEEVIQRQARIFEDKMDYFVSIY